MHYGVLYPDNISLEDTNCWVSIDGGDPYRIESFGEIPSNSIIIVYGVKYEGLVAVKGDYPTLRATNYLGKSLSQILYDLYGDNQPTKATEIVQILSKIVSVALQYAVLGWNEQVLNAWSLTAGLRKYFKLETNPVLAIAAENAWQRYGLSKGMNFDGKKDYFVLYNPCLYAERLTKSLCPLIAPGNFEPVQGQPDTNDKYLAHVSISGLRGTADKMYRFAVGRGKKHRQWAYKPELDFIETLGGKIEIDSFIKFKEMSELPSSYQLPHIFLKESAIISYSANLVSQCFIASMIMGGRASFNSPEGITEKNIVSGWLTSLDKIYTYPIAKDLCNLGYEVRLWGNGVVKIILDGNDLYLRDYANKANLTVYPLT